MESEGGRGSVAGRRDGGFVDETFVSRQTRETRSRARARRRRATHATRAGSASTRERAESPLGSYLETM